MTNSEIQKFGEIQYLKGRLDELHKALPNISNMERRRIIDQRIEKYFNHRIKFIEKRHEPKRTLANISLANQKLNWTPNVSVYEWIDGQI